MMESRFQSLIRGKKVVFITVKNKDYIRVTQVKRLLEKEASSFDVYTSEKGNPLTRALDLRRRIPGMDFSGADVIVLGFLPQLIIGEVLSKIGSDGSVKLVSDMFLSLYDTVVLDRMLVRDGFFTALQLRKLDKAVIEHSELVITDTKANASFLANTYGADITKFETLYLEADSELYDAARYALGRDSVDVDEVVKEISTFGLKGNSDSDKTEADNSKEYRVLYFGTGLPLQGTDIVLEAFDMVTGGESSKQLAEDGTVGNSSFDKKSNDENRITCTYIGSLNGVKSAVAKNATINPKVDIISWLSQKELARKIAEADLCIAGHFNLYIDKAARTIPGKAYIYEAMGKPMVLGDTKANHELFSPDEKHIFVKRGNAKELALAIREMAGI